MTTKELIILILLCVAVLFILLVGIYLLIKNKAVKTMYDTIANAMKDAQNLYADNKQKKEYVLKVIDEKCDELNMGWLYKLFMPVFNKLIDKIKKNFNSLK